MLAATIDFRISFDGSSAKHASFAVLAVKAASSLLLRTAFFVGLKKAYFLCGQRPLLLLNDMFQFKFSAIV